MMKEKKVERLQIIVRNLLITQQLVFIAVILVFLLFASFWVGQKQVSGQIYTNHLLSEKVEDYINTAINDLQILSYMPAANSSLSMVGRANNYFDVIFLIDSNGKLIGGYPPDAKFPVGRDMSSVPFFTDGKNETTLSRPFISPSTGNPTIYISMPSSDSNSIIVGELSLAGLQETLIKSQINPLGFFYITDQDGYLLAYPQYNLVQEHVDIRQTGLFEKAAQGHSVQINRLNKKWVLDVIQQNQTTGYWIIVEASVVDILGPFLFPSLIALIVVIILVLLLVHKEQSIFEEKIVSPLISLQNEAQHLSNGDFEKIKEIDIKGNSYQELLSLSKCFTTMKLAIESREVALANERNLLRTVIDNLPDAVYTKDLERRKTLSNPTDVKYCGMSGENDVLGKKDEEIYSTVTSSFSKKMEKEVLEKGKPFFNFEEILAGPSGQQIWISTSKIPLFDADHNIVGLVGIGHDITERKNAENEIHKLNTELEQRVVERTKELEAAYQELEAFSYSVSHDLRAPLRAIDGYSSIILRDYAKKLDKNGQMLFQNVRDASQRMGELIEALLKLSRISRTKLKISKIDLADIARKIFSQLQSLEPERQIDLISEKNMFVNADFDLVYIAFENLMRNAWKFTSHKENARIEVGCQKLDGQTIFFIKDNGAGFNMAYSDRLFGPFQRLHSDAEFEGTGIGLAIVKTIINNHGGEIWAEGDKGKGATFYFTFGKQ